MQEMGIRDPVIIGYAPALELIKRERKAQQKGRMR